MFPISKTRKYAKYRWKIYLLSFFLLAFALGYILGTATFYFSGDPLRNADPYPITVAPSKNRNLKTYFLTVGILSGSKNSERRQAIRNTWLNIKPSNDILHTFIIGTEGLNVTDISNLKQEKQMYHDLLLLDTVQDTYEHLTQKMLNYFSWLDKTINFNFLLKCDDDSFVQMQSIYSELVRMDVQNKLFWGFFDGRARVKKTGRWAEKNWILCDRYLPYAQGGGYVLSNDIVSFIAQNSDKLATFSNEDVSVGVWTSALKITRIHDPRFDTEFESRGCFNSYLITHKQSIDEMRKKYESLKNLGVMCPQEFRLKKSYVYNWGVPPSMCCTRNNSKVP